MNNNDTRTLLLIFQAQDQVTQTVQSINATLQQTQAQAAATAESVQASLAATGESAAAMGAQLSSADQVLANARANLAGAGSDAEKTAAGFQVLTAQLGPQTQNAGELSQALQAVGYSSSQARQGAADYYAQLAILEQASTAATAATTANTAASGESAAASTVSAEARQSEAGSLAAATSATAANTAATSENTAVASGNAAAAQAEGAAALEGASARQAATAANMAGAASAGQLQAGVQGAVAAETAQSAAAVESTASLSLLNQGYLAGVSAVASLAEAVPVLGAAFAAAASASVSFAADLQSSEDHLASFANLTQGQAQSIGQSFQSGFNIGVNSSNELVQALTPIAPMLESEQGSALTTAEAHQVMASAQDLAVASGEKLSSTTKAIGVDLRAYHEDASQSASVSNLLWNAMQLTGQGSTQVAQQLAMIHERMGPFNLDFQQAVGLLEGAAAAGDTSGRMVQSLASGFEHLLSNTKPVNTELQTLGIGLYDAQGNLESIDQIMAQVQGKMAGLSQQEQDAAEQALFGQHAFGILYQQLTEGQTVTETATRNAQLFGTAQDGAAKNSDTFNAALDRVGSGFANFGSQVGNVAITAIYGFMEHLIDTEGVISDFLLELEKIPGVSDLIQHAGESLATAVQNQTAGLGRLQAAHEGVAGAMTTGMSVAQQYGPSIDEMTRSAGDAVTNLADTTQSQLNKINSLEADSAIARQKGYLDVAQTYQDEIAALQAGDANRADQLQNLARVEESAHSTAASAASKQASTERAAASEIEAAHLAMIKGLPDVAAAHEAAANAILAGNDSLAESDKSLAREEEATDQQRSQQAAKSASDLHEASMRVIAGKQEEAAGYTAAAALESQGDTVGAQAAINAGQERQAASDASVKRAQDAAKLMGDAAVATAKGETDLAAAYVQAAGLMAAGDTAAATSIVNNAKSVQEVQTASAAAAKKAADDAHTVELGQVAGLKGVLDATNQVADAQTKLNQLSTGDFGQKFHTVTEQMLQDDQARAASATLTANQAGAAYQGYVSQVHDLEQQKSESTSVSEQKDLQVRIDSLQAWAGYWKQIFDQNYTVAKDATEREASDYQTMVSSWRKAMTDWISDRKNIADLEVQIEQGNDSILSTLTNGQVSRKRAVTQAVLDGDQQELTSSEVAAAESARSYEAAQQTKLAALRQLQQTSDPIQREILQGQIDGDTESVRSAKASLDERVKAFGQANSQMTADQTSWTAEQKALHALDLNNFVDAQEQKLAELNRTLAKADASQQESLGHQIALEQIKIQQDAAAGKQADAQLEQQKIAFQQAAQAQIASITQGEQAYIVSIKRKEEADRLASDQEQKVYADATAKKAQAEATVQELLAKLTLVGVQAQVDGSTAIVRASQATATAYVATGEVHAAVTKLILGDGLATISSSGEVYKAQSLVTTGLADQGEVAVRVSGGKITAAAAEVQSIGTVVDAVSAQTEAYDASTTGFVDGVAKHVSANGVQAQSDASTAANLISVTTTANQFKTGSDRQSGESHDATNLDQIASDLQAANANVAYWAGVQSTAESSIAKIRSDLTDFDTAAKNGAQDAADSIATVMRTLQEQIDLATQRAQSAISGGSSGSGSTTAGGTANGVAVADMPTARGVPGVSSEWQASPWYAAYLQYEQSGGGAQPAGGGGYFDPGGAYGPEWQAIFNAQGGDAYNPGLNAQQWIQEFGRSSSGSGSSSIGGTPLGDQYTSGNPLPVAVVNQSTDSPQMSVPSAGSISGSGMGTPQINLYLSGNYMASQQEVANLAQEGIYRGLAQFSRQGA